MGRPLYSQSFAPIAPVVRTDPPPPAPYEKWTYWNPFDPDSDEFFDNDPVYEAFIDLPSSVLPPVVVQLPVAADLSSSSEDTLTDTDSPMFVASDDPARSLPEVYPDYWPFPPQRQPTTTTAIPTDSPVPDVATYVPPSPQPRPLPAQSRPRSATVAVPPQRRFSYPYQNPFDGLPRTSNITPIAIPARTTVSSLPLLPPSPAGPAPSTTPRVLNWTSPPSASTPAGPLTNPNARMSLAHIAPTLIRVRDVAI